MRGRGWIRGKSGMVQFWVAASSAAWGWQNSQSGATIAKSFGFEAATPYETTNNVTRNLIYLNHAVFSHSAEKKARLNAVDLPRRNLMGKNRPVQAPHT